MNEAQLTRMATQLRRAERAIIGLSVLLVVVTGAAAAGPLVDLICRSVVVKNASGKTTAVLRENGDAEFDGRLVVQKRDILAELDASELKVVQIPVNLEQIPVTTIHKYWPLTNIGLGSAQNADVGKLDENVVVKGIADQAHAFGNDVIACWITPTNGMHEANSAPDAVLMRLDAKIVRTNKIVIVASCVGKRPANWLAAKVVVLYREKKK